MSVAQAPVVLTGATGYLGSALARALDAVGVPLLLVKRHSSDLRRLAGVRYATVDVEDGIDAATLTRLGPPQAVIHAATCYGRHGESEAQIDAANQTFPAQVLSAAAAAKVPLFINSDTSLDADVSPYAASKARFRARLDQVAQAGDIQAIHLRLEHFYGPGDDDSKFVTYLIRSCLKPVDELSLTAGTQRRDFIYVDDAVAAYLTVLQQRPQQTSCTLDVGSGEAVTVRALVERIRDLTGSPTRLNFGARQMRPNEAMLCQADVRALTALGWRCRHSLEQGLAHTIEQERAA